MRQTVGARLTLEVIEPADVMLQIAVAHPTHDAESLEITAAGDALEIVDVDIPGFLRSFGARVGFRAGSRRCRKSLPGQHGSLAHGGLHRPASRNR